MPGRALWAKRSHSHPSVPRKISLFKEVDQTPNKFSGRSCPVNLQEEKEKFLNHGILPQFKLKGSSNLERDIKKKRCSVQFEYFDEAKSVLDLIARKFGDGCNYLEVNYGEKIDFVQGTEILAEYLEKNGCEGEMTIYWTPQLECTAKMMWRGPSLRLNRPELRKYSLIIKNSTENAYLRKNGIECLANHEIGTHYLRMINDGFQPWFSSRKRFGLRPMRCRESAASEEGLAAINTLYGAKYKYLWGPAISYYTACMATKMNFRELYDHLEIYISDQEQRWKTCMRVKRHVNDPNARGGSGADQCYFEGALEILRNIDNIDFHLMYAGKICVDELNRVKRVARTDSIKLPYFLRDIEKYKNFLRSMAYVNGLGPKPERRKSPETKKLKSGTRNKISPSVSPSYSSRYHNLTATKKDQSGKNQPEKSESFERRDSEIIYPDSDEFEDELEDEAISFPHENTFVTTASRLLKRPKSSPNKIVRKKPRPKGLDSFGILQRKWEPK